MIQIRLINGPMFILVFFSQNRSNWPFGMHKDWRLAFWSQSEISVLPKPSYLEWSMLVFLHFSFFIAGWRLRPVTLKAEGVSFQVLSEITECKRLSRFRFVNKSISRATKLLLVMLSVFVYSANTVRREGVVSTLNLLGWLFMVPRPFVLPAAEIINTAILSN